MTLCDVQPARGCTFDATDGAQFGAERTANTKSITGASGAADRLAEIVDGDVDMETFHADFLRVVRSAVAVTGLQAGAQTAPALPQQFSVKKAIKPFMLSKSAA